MTSRPRQGPSRAEVDRQFTAVLAGTLSREEVSRWAAQYVAHDDLRVEDEPVWDALCLLGGVDTRHGPEPYLYDDVQLRRWLDDFRRRCAEDFGIADDAVVTLWRPTGPEELALVEASGWRVWPPRLPDQPIFYPVLNENYATKIARDWNVKASGIGYVTRFHVRKSFMDRYDVQQVGGRPILEYWIPAEDLDDFNANIVGKIEVVATYTRDS